MKKKPLFILVPLIIVVFVLLWLSRIYAPKYYPKKVLWIPYEFVNLKEVTEDAKSIMQYIFFEEYISLVDINGKGIGGALVKDSSFIVDYRGEYYVNAEKFYTALEKAREIAANNDSADKSPTRSR